jgi:hypothetical protein
MPTVFASVSATIVLFMLATLGIAHFHLLPVGLHMLWGFFIATLIVLLQCLIFGFFIGSGKSIKRVVQENNLAAHWVQKTKDYKNQSYPALMLAIVVTVAAAALGGGVGAGSVAPWVHAGFMWLALAANIRSLWISYQAVVANVNAIHLINAEVESRQTEGRSVIAPEVKPPEELIVNRPPPTQASKYYFLAIVAWVPYLYMRFSLSSRGFPLWPFILLSAGLALTGWWRDRKDA